jgi:hypothetical protein
MDYEEQLKTVTYRDLETFELDRIGIDTATCMIKNSGGNLRKISIHEYFIYDDYTFYDNSLKFIRIIYENCPLVEYLSIPVFPSSYNHFNDFEKLLETCQKLRTLYFEDTYYYLEKELGYADNLLNVLIRAAPANLKNIRFNYAIKFSLEILEEFLEKWRGRPAISLIVDSSEPSYVNLINKYKNEGVIK